MNITKRKVATILYTLHDSNGTVLDSSEGQDPLYHLHGENNLIPVMEEGLEGRTTPGELTHGHVHGPGGHH